MFRSFCSATALLFAALTVEAQTPALVQAQGAAEVTPVLNTLKVCAA